MYCSFISFNLTKFVLPASVVTLPEYVAEVINDSVYFVWFFSPSAIKLSNFSSKVCVESNEGLSISLLTSSSVVLALLDDKSLPSA
ncbi:hypothetical protein MM26B8_00110 [Mycoplasmopsis meleagridis]|uniref:Uncharacterized protein n=1 Tax=Mycoplasmopsis meleagridis ATCC 25294 TaxID=1264554 RepID=A0A0F5H1R2_9BACT|nr:hypothetical protein MMELEA_02600 [Mycoplasmopsis meleagridis ATCC 25294]OAD18607.1 hypothetical protein MM26B8_00110 [Mycoplasmopsis meleagridis]